MREKWEYKYEDVDPDFWLEMDDFLKMSSREGWEILTVIAMPGQSMKPRHRFYLKREKVEEWADPNSVGYVPVPTPEEMADAHRRMMERASGISDSRGAGDSGRVGG